MSTKDIKQAQAMLQIIADSINEIRERNERRDALLVRMYRIMCFHAGRCPLRPHDNFSGTEEHLAEYRAVLIVAKEELTKDEQETPERKA